MSSSEKLKRYLAYYQRTLKLEPDNIEARLRLATIFRELGKDAHAVEEYVAASKLLAREGLPLEAIAACKTVLELDPDHSEVQYFLARLFARVPQKAGQGAHVAQPVSGAVQRINVPVPDADEPHQPITLRKKKSGVRDVLDEADTGPLRGEDIPSLEDVEGDERTTDEFAAVERDTVPERPIGVFGTIDLDDSDIISVREDEGPATEETVVLEEFPTVRGARPVSRETFEVPVFDLESLALDESDREFVDLSFLDEIGALPEEDPERTVDISSRQRPAMLSVSRADLPETPIFSELSPDLFMELLREMDLRQVPRGYPILEPGHSTTSLFVVVRGRVDVTRNPGPDQINLGTVSEGGFFGEFGMLTGQSSEASVHAATDVDLLVVRRDVVDRIARSHPEIWDVLWQFYHQRMLQNLLASSAIFSPLSVAERQALAAKFELVDVVGGDVFLKSGEQCAYLYLVLRGGVVAERDHGGLTEELARMGPGEFFGIASSLGDDPYVADLRALTDSSLLRLAAEDFRAVADENDDVLAGIQEVMRTRRKLDVGFTSGILSYAETGIGDID